MKDKKEHEDADESFNKWIDLIRNEITRQKGEQKRFSYRIVKRLQDENQTDASGNRNWSVERVQSSRKKRSRAIRRGYSGKPIPYGATALQMNLPTLYKGKNNPKMKARKLEWLRSLVRLMADKQVAEKLPRLFGDRRVAEDVFRILGEFP